MHTLTINNKCQCWDLIYCGCGCIKYVRYSWVQQFGHLHFVYCAWVGFTGGEEWDYKLHAWYCSCAIQHVMWYVYTYFAFYSRVSHGIFQVTCMQVSSLNWAVLYGSDKSLTTTSHAWHTIRRQNVWLKIEQSSLGIKLFYYKWL